MHRPGQDSGSTSNCTMNWLISVSIYLNYLRKELVFSRKLTDEALSFFRDIDVMNSTGMMTWLVDTCSEAITHSNETIEYNGKNLDAAAFVALLVEQEIYHITAIC